VTEQDLSPLALAGDAVNPNDVPKRTLYTGAKIPVIGFGTFGSDRFSGESIAEAVKDAIEDGYRHLDCASIYQNEHLIGQSLREVMMKDIKREDLWITSKLWNDKHAEKDVIPACEKSLEDLQLDYLDLYLIHWPFPNHHTPGADANSRDPNAKPYIHEEYMKTWHQLEKLVEMGWVRNIGTSNMTIPKLKLLLRDATIKPACNEMELHPHFQQPELYRFVVDNGMIPIGYSPVGSPSRPDRDRAPEDTVDIEDPVIVKIAKRLEVHPAVVCIKWGIQRGQIVIPFSINRDHYISNLRATVSDPLTDVEMKEIAGIDKGCRLIKGQVLMWEGARSWEDLWDLNGEINSS
jgi:alcohol dehydrogenase (NADP+)